MRHSREQSLIATGVVLAAAVLAAATPALTQSRGGGGGAPMTGSQGSGRPVDRMTADQQLRRFEADEFRSRVQAEELTIEEAEERYGADRVALAERVQALMNAGQCDEARRVASEAGERSMALRVRQSCRRQRQ